MQKHYFTFGTYPERVQVIVTDRPERAEQIMFDAYGTNWAFQYTEEQWQQSLEEGYFKSAKYLAEIVDPLIKDNIERCDRCGKLLNKLENEDIYLEKISSVVCGDCHSKEDEKYY